MTGLRVGSVAATVAAAVGAKAPERTGSLLAVLPGPAEGAGAAAVDGVADPAVLAGAGEGAVCAPGRGGALDLTLDGRREGQLKGCEVKKGQSHATHIFALVARCAGTFARNVVTQGPVVALAALLALEPELSVGTRRGAKFTLNDQGKTKL